MDAGRARKAAPKATWAGTGLVFSRGSARKSCTSLVVHIRNVCRSAGEEGAERGHQHTEKKKTRRGVWIMVSHSPISLPDDFLRRNADNFLRSGHRHCLQVSQAGVDFLRSHSTVQVFFNQVRSVVLRDAFVVGVAAFTSQTVREPVDRPCRRPPFYCCLRLLFFPSPSPAWASLASLSTVRLGCP